ncbi:MAG: hypothetical protein OEZ54_03870 [Gemmatimonadota bacterium]|nr:hypothetical protein [Gemmatimonadota bacterium]
MAFVRVWSVLLLLLGASSPVAYAQTLASAIEDAPDGFVRMSYAVRDGVCGNGENMSFSHGRLTEHNWECEPGPARVTVEKRNGIILDIKTRVGGNWFSDVADVTELGEVDSREAAQWLASIVETGESRVARRAIMPASIARDSDAWRVFLRVAGDQNRPSRLRRAVFQQLGIEAGAVELEGAEDQRSVGDVDARTQAVFALSQFPDDQSVPLLMDVARTHSDADLRRVALFWLGQKQDARVLDLFQEVLTRP